MALFDPEWTRCPLCNQLSGDDADCIATSHFIGDDAHPLWRYSDAVIHRRCFSGWKDRHAFVEKYIEEVYPRWFYRIKGLYLWAIMWWLTRRCT